MVGRIIGDLKFLFRGKIIAEYVPVVISVVLPDNYIAVYVRIRLRRFVRGNCKLNRIIGPGNIRSVNIPIAKKVVLPDDYVAPDSWALLVVFN